MISRAMGFFYKHYTIYKKSKADKATLLIYPLVSLFSVGVLALYLKSSGSPPGVIPFVIVGVIAWTFYELCQRAIVYGMTFDIWDYALKHMIISPASIMDYVAGNSLFGLAGGIFSVALLLALSAVFFGFSAMSGGAAFFISLVVLFIFAISVGLGICSLMLAYDKEYLAFVWSTPGIIMVFSGVYYPISMLPGAIKAVAYLLPTTYAIDAMRISLGLAEGSAWKMILAGFVISAAYFTIFFRTFCASLENARRTGRTISG